MAYTRVNWEDLPSTNTPRNATNLNKMDKGIKDVDDALTTLSGSLATVATSGSYDDLSNKPSLATVATSGSYNDLSNKPTIPTVNNATLTITQNGTSMGTFTANQSTNKTIALTNTTYSNATTSASGLMSSTDKGRLDNIYTYSSSEQRVGTWIDGKPLYRKVIEFTTSASNVTTWTNCATISNLKRPIDIHGFLEYNSTTSSYVPTFESSSQRLQFSFTGNNVQYQSAGFGSKKVFAVVLYTKTTD